MHRTSSLACAALAGVLFHSGPISAVALGNIALQSSLGQPLRVVIPVALSNGETLNTTCVKLLRDPAIGTPQLLTGRVSVEQNAANTRLIVTTARAIDEPVLRLSVQAGCSDTTRRDYVLLLDLQGTESSARVASADLDEFRNYAGAARAAAAASPLQRGEGWAAPSGAAVAASTPVPTTFTSIAAPAPIAVARTQNTVPSIPIVALAATPGEPVGLTAAQPRSGFIAEVSAASLSRASADRPITVTVSSPTALPRTRADGPEATLWTQTWPYAAVLLSIGAIVVTAFAKRRRIVVPAWGTPTESNSLKSSTQNKDAANTFAHFGAMTEPAPIVLHPIADPPVTSDSTHDPSLDTLFQDAQLDVIDEAAIRNAWTTAVSESDLDIGTESILKAIAAAERDLNIGPAEPVQAAIDQALDEDLMHGRKPHH